MKHGGKYFQELIEALSQTGTILDELEDQLFDNIVTAIECRNCAKRMLNRPRSFSRKGGGDMVTCSEECFEEYREKLAIGRAERVSAYLRKHPDKSGLQAVPNKK